MRDIDQQRCIILKAEQGQPQHVKEAHDTALAYAVWTMWTCGQCGGADSQNTEHPLCTNFGEVCPDFT